MIAAVSAAHAARGAKLLSSASADQAQAAIEKSGICRTGQQNFSQGGSRCMEHRPRPTGQPYLGKRSGDDWNEFGFFASRFKSETMSTGNAQTMSHPHFDHLVAYLSVFNIKKYNRRRSIHHLFGFRERY